MKSNTKRIELLDELRGFAIVAMIIHHFFLDMGMVLDLDIGYQIFDKLCVAQPVFWAIFIITSGICSRLSRNAVKRGVIVLGAGMVVTLVTAVIMPRLGMDGAQIYFGILHCLGCCMIITGLFMPIIKKINPLIGCTVSLIIFLLIKDINSNSLVFGLIKFDAPSTNLLMPLGIYNNSFVSADYFSIIPWIFMFLFGAFIGKYAKDGAFPSWSYKRHIKSFAFVGRNSLWFYLGHQAIIYAILYAFLEIIKIYAKIKVG